jgi:ubiquinone/menaquinone biosynthesis C-methylase UbiE
MAVFVTVVVAVLVLLIGAALWWRYASRRRSVPCPTWLYWSLENPYTEALAGSEKLLNRARLAPGMRVLDAGCGKGRLSLPAGRRVAPDGEVVALDIQSGMLREVEKRVSASGLTNVRTFLCALGVGELERNVFDRAFLVTVLGEIPNRKEALQEIHRTLKPNGILSVTELFPDPHYNSQGCVCREVEATGLRHVETFGNKLAFTMNFIKPAAAPLGSNSR